MKSIVIEIYRRIYIREINLICDNIKIYCKYAIINLTLQTDLEN